MGFLDTVLVGVLAALIGNLLWEWITRLPRSK